MQCAQSCQGSDETNCSFRWLRNNTPSHTGVLGLFCDVSQTNHTPEHEVDWTNATTLGGLNYLFVCSSLLDVHLHTVDEMVGEWEGKRQTQDDSIFVEQVLLPHVLWN